MDALVQKRGRTKAKLTRFRNYVEKLQSDLQEPNENLSNRQGLELQERLEELDGLLNEFNDIQIDIETLSNSTEREPQEQEQFENSFYFARSLAKDILSKNDQHQVNNDARSLSPCSSRRSSCGHKSVKLPVINIPKFSGDIEDWLEYRDVFNSLINENSSISDIQKFHYLRASLSVNASQIIKSLEFTASNYQVAWNSICERYNNSRMLTHNHIKSIFNLEPLNKESSVKLRNLSDMLFKHFNCLKSLADSGVLLETIIIYIITMKLDNTSAREWETYKNNNGSELPTLDQFKLFLKNTANLVETLELKQIKSTTDKHSGHDKLKPRVKSFVSTNPNCSFCNKKHLIYNCDQFTKLSASDRNAKVHDLKLCPNCLTKGHSLSQCKSRFTCKHCYSRHHSLLHEKSNNITAGVQSSASHASVDEPNVTITAFASEHVQVLLPIASANIIDATGNMYPVRVLLDSGSQSNFISTDLCRRLQIPTTEADVLVSGVNKAISKIRSMCEVQLQSRNSSFNANISCLVIDNITGNLPPFNLNLNKINIPQGIELSDPHFYKPGVIDLLLGSSIFWRLLCYGQIRLGPNLPILQKTRLGWVVSGPLYQDSGLTTHCNFAKLDIQDQLARFWEIEHYPTEKALSEEELGCERHFIENTKRSPEGRFIVSIPLKESPTLLGDSLQLATKQFLSLERKLQRNPGLRERYVAFMSEYEELGHMSPISSTPSDFVYYLPHHGVLKEESLTTKLRVVFNGSAKTSTGHSLNSIQMVGPTIQQDLFSILLRFRKYVYAISADIEKMYRQVFIEPQQRSLQRILWRYSPETPIQAYELNTVTYGTASSSFLSIRALAELGIECQEEFPQMSQIIREDFYVDDLLTGADTLCQAQNICRTLPHVLQSGCFKLRKWISNDARALDDVLHSDIHPGVLEFGSHEHTSTLGLIWSFQTDHLKYKLSSSVSNQLTKRSMLSEISQIFDPLGLLTPCTISAKIALQQLWLQKLSWDDPIPSNIQDMWLKYKNNLVVLNELTIPRRVLCENPLAIELHGFADASIHAYGCNIYLRSITQSQGVHVSLLCAKSKVAPLKPLTIPRLELCAATLLSKLFQQVAKALKINFSKVTLWSDSTIVLSWIKTTPNLLKTFVCNRVVEIQTLTANASWRHLPTATNPADLASRGISPLQMADSQLWWHGPSFLFNDESTWPSFTNSVLNLPELKGSSLCLHGSVEYSFTFSRFSNLTRLERVIAYCLRFVYNSKASKDKRQCGPLSVTELRNSFTFLVKLSQHQSFPNELNHLLKGKQVHCSSTITALSPFLDKDGTIRVGGRLQNSTFGFSKKHPALLSGNHHLSKLIMAREHLRLLHAGPQLLLANTREKFWITSGRSIARQTVHKCHRCFRFSAKNTRPIMGNLPAARLQPAPPFTVTGVDYAGPITIKDRKGRGCKVFKSYICLFICFATKAVHLELVTDLSTQTFLLSFKRFISRRGKPSDIYSDNGTNFVSANSELLELGKFLKDQTDVISEAVANEGITWHFTPAYSPHFGGLWEAGVKSCKHHLKRITGNALFTYEELSTLLTQIEAILNSRPLSPLSSDPNDLQPLTPAHFLIGRPLTAPPEPNVKDIPEGRLSLHQKIQALQQHFWARWSKEYVSELQVRTKWRENKSDLQKDTLVLIKDDHLPPIKWKIGRVIEVHPGKDGINRVASIRTSSGIIRRAFLKICPLPSG